MTHPLDAPCPFESDNFPIGMLASCCSLRGKIAAWTLEDFGYSGLYVRMHGDMTCKQAVQFSDELRRAADDLQRRRETAKQQLKGGSHDLQSVRQADRLIWRDDSTIDEALEAFREAARWYEKVGSMGFGVHAWY